MGISNSKYRKLQIIDFGSIVPLGLYEKNDGYDLNTVKQLILSKRLCPFYKGLSNPLQVDCCNTTAVKKDRKKKTLRRKKKLNVIKESDYIHYLFKNQKVLYNILYRSSIECPICFLYYPANINFARCCDQPICTECFVQIKKTPADSNTTATCSSILCPYCMTENFGIIYHCPSQPMSLEKCYKMRSTTSGLSDHQQQKRKSIDSDHPDVVLIDHVRSKLSIDSNNSSRVDSLLRASSIQLWFQSRNASSSLDRYLSTIRLDNVQDMMVMDSIRQSLIDKGIYQENGGYSSRQVV